MQGARILMTAQQVAVELKFIFKIFWEWHFYLLADESFTDNLSALTEHFSSTKVKETKKVHSSPYKVFSGKYNKKYCIIVDA